LFQLFWYMLAKLHPQMLLNVSVIVIWFEKCHSKKINFGPLITGRTHATCKAPNFKPLINEGVNFKFENTNKWYMCFMGCNNDVWEK